MANEENYRTFAGALFTTLGWCSFGFWSKISTHHNTEQPFTPEADLQWPLLSPKPNTLLGPVIGSSTQKSTRPQADLNQDLPAGSPVLATSTNCKCSIKTLMLQIKSTKSPPSIASFCHGRQNKRSQQENQSFAHHSTDRIPGSASVAKNICRAQH